MILGRSQNFMMSMLLTLAGLFASTPLFVSAAEPIYCESMLTTGEKSGPFTIAEESSRKIFTDRLDQYIEKRKTPSDFRFGTVPLSARGVRTSKDALDVALWRASDQLQREFGRFELLNQAGESIGVVLFSGENAQINGSVMHSAFIKVLAQAWADGHYFDIKKVILEHTHPGQGTLAFSESDKECFKSQREQMNQLGLGEADLQADLLATAFLGEFKKTGIIIPAGTLMLDPRESLAIQKEAISNYLLIESLGKQLREGKINLIDLMFEMPANEFQIFKALYQVKH